MFQRPFYCLSVLFLFIFAALAYADDQPEKINPPTLIQKELKNAHWIFTGMVKNDKGERIGYYFKLQRQGNLFQAQAALLDGQSHQSILHYEKSKTIENPKDLKWKIGQAFLNYNPVNANWSFGVKDKNGQGFNFKLNMVEKPDEDQKEKTLRSGLDILARQTSRLTGHIQIGNESTEQFVHANHTWFARAWQNENDSSAHQIKGLFCRLNDGSGFYAVKLKESDAVQAAMAGWRDKAGNPVKMSQFVRIKKQPEQEVLVQISLPKFDKAFKNLLPANATEKAEQAGFFKGTESGFCLLSWEKFNPLMDKK